AAKICDNYSVTVGGTTYDDWFLPSKDELNEIYQNRATINATAGNNGGGNLADNYWSSTENTNSEAWYQFFGTKIYQFTMFKGNDRKVRAVRAF
ncbi:MAG: DUF1566 domain-containing protein, partial [Schleiferiaceae bacterium]|nr:DUF1566 domain-containing protein [Schleiferiaceae bacterium]MDR9443123.1 DUF1566 domain-containing protein [Schleiferiaceae bacterium]